MGMTNMATPTSELESSGSETLDSTKSGGSPTGQPRILPRNPDPSSGPVAIGAYRLLEELGRGGMGIVFLAEQTEPVRRRVALKMLQSAVVPRDLEIRFESERRAMARLQHPNIAQLFEADSTDDGHPYFVMELVDGVPITEYCDAIRLGIRDRIELFQAVCEGVQHAHEKGLLHRDLKPANILIAEENVRPIPKILDFGIAKAIDQPLVDGTLLTGERVVGTPAYLSPEAIRGGLDLDTRSDVYSLGVLLYELLVGVRPFETGGVPMVVVLNKLMRDEPKVPSTRWGGLGRDEKTTLADTRGHDPTSLPRRLRGDLDWIVLKALAKDREDRYHSASELAADLGRHLRWEPVVASPPTALYRAGKFVRRRRGFVVGAVLLFASLLLGLAGTLANLRRAEDEAERANREAARASREALRANREAIAAQEALDEVAEVSNYLQSLFEVSDPGARGRTVTARELLDRGAERIRTDFESRPLARARFMVTIGDVYTQLGLYDEALPLLEDAVEVRQSELGRDDLAVAAALEKLGWLHSLGGRLDQAEPLFRRTLEIRESRLGTKHPEVAASLNRVGGLLVKKGQAELAETLLQRALAIRLEALGPNHQSVAQSLNNLGWLYRMHGRAGEAAPLLERAVEVLEHNLGHDHVTVSYALNNLGMSYQLMGRTTEALELSEKALEIRRAALEPDHPRIAEGLGVLGFIYWQQGRLSEAEGSLRKAYEIQTARLQPDHGFIAAIEQNLAGVLRDQQQFPEAESLYLRSLRLREETLPPGHPMLRETLADYAQLLRATGRGTEAKEYKERAGIPAGSEIDPSTRAGFP